ncbi:hypothetical protein MNEG_9361 [Monoraphidium neglectum]|jgi:hypothetical protein|uniref:Uncharacterized protein n=1 Tax=Monoraphidium neglectum TaxID=145388 RepID=A0A0D2M538_9CHLO|nr:hypothetical protein MNEG_9361 [Monoraphidium neglectum]KIY98599.1 hypothetical protein MNEG_9361 [Monoraphidium neglectum]|eukprot:XP_013897619.1 hypothetical protein MNEG_9361 [Monoraphidium neglectum]
MNSACELHGAASTALLAPLQDSEQQERWPTAPLPGAAPAGMYWLTPPKAVQLEEQLGQHMVLIDMDDACDDSPPQQKQQHIQQPYPRARQPGPITPNGYTPAEVERGRA